MRILLVDDNYDDRLLIAHALEQEFPEVELQEVFRAQDLEEALLLRQFDLAITDYELRWTNGLTVVGAIKNLYPDCPVIMFTASGTQEIAVEAMKLGLDDYILKSAHHYVRLPAAVKLALEKVETQRKVAGLESRLQTLLDNLNVGIYRLSQDGVLLEVNKAFLRLAGLGDITQSTEILSKLQFNGTRDKEIILRYENDIPIWVRISQTVTTKPSGAIIIDGLMEDISLSKQREAERLKAMAELATAKEELKRQNKEAREANRIKDQFIAIVSHELRSPLTAILGWAKILRSGKLSETKQAQGLETIERNANLQNTLIEDILDISRIIQNRLRLNKQPIHIVPIVQSVLLDVKPLVQAKSISLESKIGASVGTIMGDVARLGQVISNLVNNAIKFTPQGGHIFVELQQINSSIQFTVKDTGVGIGADFLPHVFEPFRQADNTKARTHNGLGLGLAIVRNLVEMHNGAVKVMSEGIGKGATFTVELPIYSISSQEINESLEKSKQDEVEEVPSLSGIHILIVDDDKDTRELLAQIIEGYEAKVTTTASASEALSVLVQLEPDILLSDIAMPQEDGYSLIRKIRSQPGDIQRIPAIALTAFAREEDRKQALEAGFQQHLVKPVNPTELVTAVCRLGGRANLR
ncbi:MAG: response regulator [Calothrix sp. FI2-JRJ7]|nr:response regulator [Calothrix sp. FI2-JRJ7]